MDAWSPTQYLKFADQRNRPVFDLLNAISSFPAKNIVDIGCGPGNSTLLLRRYWPSAKISAFDPSPEMVTRARQSLASDIRVAIGNVIDWSPSDEDILFSNAVFQWVPHHLDELERLVLNMKTGALLAIQMPDNLDEPIHRVMRQIASTDPFSVKLRQVNRAPLHAIGVYYDRLVGYAKNIELWHTYYYHIMNSIDEIIEWVKGTGLRPFLEPLTSAEQQLFLARYRSAITDLYPRQSDGKIMFRFPRLFVTVVRK